MIEIIIIASCIFLNALLSLVEMAFVAVNRSILRNLVRNEKNKEALRVLRLRESPERTLSVLQIGISLVGGVAAVTGGAGMHEFLSPFLQSYMGFSEGFSELLGVAIVVMPITYLSVVLGELVPKAISLRNPLAIILKSARWLVIADTLLHPVVTTLEWSTKKILSLFPRGKHVETAGALDLDLEQLSREHRQYVLNLVDIEKKRIKDIMIPWNQVVTINVQSSIEEVMAIIIESGHTRLPVMSHDAVIGILHTKEFVAFRASGHSNWHSILRPVIEFQANESLLRALRVMQEKRSRLSIVFSLGTRIGIVTVEDIIEEIIGDLFDEDDDGAIKRLLSMGSARRVLREP